jgi:hypothetical protein
MDDTAMGVTGEVPQMSFVQRLLGIFFEPTKTFADIERKATWIGIFVILAILGTAVAYVLMSHIDVTAMMRQQMEARNMSEAQINAAMETQQQNPILKNLRYVSVFVAPIAQIVTYLLIASLLLLLFVLMGAPLTFKKTLAVTIWGMSPAAIVTSILMIVLIYVKNPADLSVAQDIVMSNLGPLVNAKTNPFLHSVLGSIDLFSFWTIALLSIGFATISRGKLTTKKAATGVLILWIIYVLGKSAYRMIVPIA